MGPLSPQNDMCQVTFVWRLRSWGVGMGEWSQEPEGAEFSKWACKCTQGHTISWATFLGSPMSHTRTICQSPRASTRNRLTALPWFLSRLWVPVPQCPACLSHQPRWFALSPAPTSWVSSSYLPTSLRPLLWWHKSLPSVCLRGPHWV